MHSWMSARCLSLSSLPPPLVPGSRARSQPPSALPPALPSGSGGIHSKEATAPPRTSLTGTFCVAASADAPEAPEVSCLLQSTDRRRCRRLCAARWALHMVCAYGLHIWPTRRRCRQLTKAHEYRTRETIKGGMEVRNITPAALAIAMHAAPDGVPCPCAPTLECQQTRQGGRTWT